MQEIEEQKEEENFEIINSDDYDFEMKNFFTIFKNVQIEEFRTDDEVYYLPTTKKKLENSFVNEQISDKGQIGDLDKINQSQNINQNQFSEFEEHSLGALTQLQEQFEYLKRSLTIRSKMRKTKKIISVQKLEGIDKFGNDDDNISKGSDSKSEFSIVEPEQDHSIINFYNNNEQRNQTKSMSDFFSQQTEIPESLIQNLLINTKFKIDSQLQPRVKISKYLKNKVCMLGREFSAYDDDKGQILFQREFQKNIWLTYRKGFVPLLIEKNKVAKLTSDAGWGCVIRCTQMLLANSLRKILRQKYGEIAEQKFLISSQQSFQSQIQIQANKDEQINLKILELFDDDKRNLTESPFSIQNIVELGLQEHGRLPGEWYGVSKMNKIFKTLHDTYNFDEKMSNNCIGNFKICEFSDGEILVREVVKEGIGSELYKQLLEKQLISENIDFEDELNFNQLANKQEIEMQQQDENIEQSNENQFDFQTTRVDIYKKALEQQSIVKQQKEKEQIQQHQCIIRQHFKNQVLITVSIQLGLQKIPSEYYDTIKELMRMKWFVGSVGGRPNLAYYFVGVQYSSSPNDQFKLIYLDPHFVQSKVYNLHSEYLENPEKFHCSEARVIDISELDPSISFGYLIKSYDEFLEFADQINQINESLIDQNYKVLTIQSEGIEQRILRDLRNLADQQRQQFGENYPVSGFIHSIVSMDSDYIKNF